MQDVRAQKTIEENGRTPVGRAKRIARNPLPRQPGHMVGRAKSALLPPPGLDDPPRDKEGDDAWRSAEMRMRLRDMRFLSAVAWNRAASKRNSDYGRGNLLSSDRRRRCGVSLRARRDSIPMVGVEFLYYKRALGGVKGGISAFPVGGSV